LIARLDGGHTVTLDDPMTAARFAAEEVESWRDAGIYCFVPCVFEGGAIAVLALGHKQTDEPFNSEDLSLLTAVASQVATLETADGLKLVGELALPAHRDPVATMVCLHPLPTHGGMMDSHLFRKASYRLPALAGIAVLRFNTRGTSSLQGTSEGAFDNAMGERFDVAAAI